MTNKDIQEDDLLDLFNNRIKKVEECSVENKRQIYNSQPIHLMSSDPLLYLWCFIKSLVYDLLP